MEKLFCGVIQRAVEDYENALNTLLKIGLVKKPERTILRVTEKGRVIYIPVKEEKPEYKQQLNLYKKYREALETKIECEAFFKDEIDNYEIDTDIHGDRIIREIRNRVFENYEKNIAKINKEEVYNKYLNKFEKQIIKDLKNDK